MKKIIVTLLGVALSGAVAASTCSSSGFDSASKANNLMLTEIQDLSKQYVAVCSWEYDMSREEICSLFTNKVSELASINQQALTPVLDSAEKTTEQWYALHESCAEEGNKSNSSAAFKAYEDSFEVYEMLIKEVETRYNGTCRKQLKENVKEYCK